MIALLAGCASSWEGSWTLIPVAGTEVPPDCPVTVEENFLSASPRDDSEPGSWPDLPTGAEVAALTVTALGDGGYGVEIGDRLLVGDEVDGALVVRWSHPQSFTVPVVAADYTLEHTVDVEMTEELTLTVQPGESVGVGAVVAGAVTVVRWVEPDQWDVVGSGVSFSGIPTFSWLDGTGNYSRPSLVDCEGGSCELTTTTTCAATLLSSVERAAVGSR